MIKYQHGELPPPGIYYDVPAIIYHSWPAIHSSLVKGYADLPSTCKRPYIPKDDAAVGSGIHAYTLQGKDALMAECAFMGPESVGRSKPALAYRALFEMDNSKKSCLPFTYGDLPMMEVLERVDKELKSHPSVGSILEESVHEVSLVWIDDETGVPCKARLDIWQPKTRQIWDIKKTSKFDQFGYEITRLKYKLQGAFYMMGARSCGLDPVTFGLIPCEAEHPFRVGIGYLRDNESDADGTLDGYQMECRRLVNLIVESQVSGNWPNFRIPEHIFSLNDLTGEDLIGVW